MKQLRINDNSKINKDACQEISNLVNLVSDKTLEQLENCGIFVFPECIKDAGDLSGEQMVLQQINDMYHTGNVMGFIGYGDERLIIQSRFNTGDEDFLFQYMLKKVIDFPNVVNLQTEAANGDRMSDMLIFLFPMFLSKALRKGVYKTFELKQYNDDAVKGVIDVERHIRNNIPFVGKIAYNQREHTFDNYLMELVRHTIEFIKRKSYGYKLLAKVKDEVKLVVDATSGYEAKNRQKVMFENKKNMVRHAFYHEYRALQKLCMLILQNEKTEIGVGSTQIYGILFDGAWLWEQYINMVINHNEEMFYHPNNKAKEGRQYLFSGSTGLIYPDFISCNSKNRIIADAKYKPIENIGNKDYLQVLAYMFRFEAKKAFYFYPDAEWTGGKILWLNKGSTYEDNVEAREEVCMIKHGLKIPKNVVSYAEFIDAITKSEKEFRDGIFNIDF